jgi:hypothetical protein
LREHDKIKPDDTFKIMDLHGIFVPMPVTPTVPELAGEIEQTLVHICLSVEEMLASLRDRREWYVREKYGPALQ